jgi:hypothetical protein
MMASMSVDVERLRILDVSVDFHRPRTGAKIFGVDRWVTFIGAKLVEVVVAGHVFEWGGFFRGAELALGSIQLSTCRFDYLLGSGEFAYSDTEQSGRTYHAGGGNKAATVEVKSFGGDFGTGNIGGLFNQHDDLRASTNHKLRI